MIKENPKDLVPTFFNNTSNSYDDIVHWTTFGKDSLWKHKILEQLSDEKTVLDLACGTGILTKQIAKKLPQAKITGVDITKNYLEKAKEKLISYPNIFFTCADKESTFILNSAAAKYFFSFENTGVITLKKYPNLPLLKVLLPAIAMVLKQHRWQL